MTDSKVRSDGRIVFCALEIVYICRISSSAHGIDEYDLVVRVGEASASVTRPNSYVEVCTTLVVFIDKKCL